MKLLIQLSLCTLLLTACEDKMIYPATMSAADKEAIEGMHMAYNQAVAYNDSLAECQQQLIPCFPNELRDLDEHYHHQDSMYTMHHGHYTHANSGDDHDEHGHMHEMEHHDDDHHHDDNHGHHMDDHDMMDSLHEAHEEWHP